MSYPLRSLQKNDDDIQQKHIKIKVISDKEFIITSQSHRGPGFGSKGEEFLASNGVLLYSAVYPRVYFDEPTTWGRRSISVACRGAEQERDEDILYVKKASDIHKIMEAVKEYNLFFNGGLVYEDMSHLSHLEENLFEI